MILLLDSSALINNQSFYFDEAEQYVVTAKIMDEFREFRVRQLVENALETGRLKIENPSPAKEEEVKARISSQGFRALSKADVSLIALAQEYKEKRVKFSVLTDDYSIQNFLSLSKIEFSGVAQGTIKKPISFSKYCPGCGRTAPSGSREKECDLCGTALKKKRVRERPLFGALKGKVSAKDIVRDEK